VEIVLQFSSFLLSNSNLQRSSSFTAIQSTDGGFHVRGLFSDRSRLEFKIDKFGSIDVDTTFKFLDKFGVIHEFGWNSKAKEIAIPEIGCYLNEAICYVHKLQGKEKEITKVVEEELRKIKQFREKTR
jgi:hypothetical protein